MNRQMTCGTSSISFQNPVFVQSCASVVSRKEGEGPLGAYFDTICEDPMFGTDTWEAAESTLQKQAALLAIKKNGLTCSDIQLLFAGDLLAQTSVFSEHAPLWENLFPLVQCVSTAGTENISSAQLPATLPAQKKNFVFPWDMEIKGPYLLPGQSPVPEPVYLDMNRHHARTTKH